MSAFRAGQVWKYRTRPGEEESRLVVCKVEPHERLGPIIHIHVEGVAINSTSLQTGVIRAIGHMPFAEESLRGSVVGLEGTRTQLPSYEDGYDAWKSAFDDGNAGIFTISVADGVAFMEQALNR